MARATRVVVFAASLLAALASPGRARDVAFHNVLQEDSAAGWGVAAGDINGDGKLDLVVTDDSADTVEWLDLTGLGATHTIATAVAGATGVAVADFDGDGDLDVAAAARDLDDVLLWTNTNGLGTTWGAPITVASVSTGVTDLVAGDIDRDGDVDLVGAVTGDDIVRRWRNNGDGTGWAQGVVSNTAGAVEDVELADVDRDGDLDVMAAETGDGEVRWFANAGAGVNWTENTIDAALSSPVGISVADIDLDGDPDVAAALEGSGEAVWWENTAGDGSAWSGTPEPIGDIAAITAVGVADLDGDGDQDVAATSATFGAAAGWFEQTAPGVWLARALDAGPREPRRLLLTDLFEDGDTDLVYPSAGNGSGIWSMENRDHRRRPRFRAETAADSGISRRSTNDWARGDVNGDGREDAVFNDLFVPPDDDIVWLAIGGPGANADILNFSLNPLAIGDPNGFAVLDLGDVDGDGDLDLLGVPPDPVELVDVWENDGTLSNWPYGGRIVQGGSLKVKELATGDLDGDGDLDVAALVEDFPVTERIMVWYEQVDDLDPFDPASWTRHDIDSATDASLLVTKVRIGDVDGDLDLDIATGHDTGPIIVWRNLGVIAPGTVPTFARQDLPTPSSTHIELADFDRDGDLDVGGLNAWWENDPTAIGGWVRHEVTGMQALSAIDLDRDGDVDLVGGTCESGGQEYDACWWRNEVRNPSGGWYGYPLFSLSTQTDWLVAADFDGDHDGDVLGGQGSLGPGLFTGSFRNTGGHAALAAETLADFTLEEGEIGTVLALDFEFGGAFGDGPMEVSAIAFSLEADGVPVDTPTLASLVAAVEVHRDDGDGIRNAGDTLVTRVTSLTADAGLVAVGLPDGDPALQLSWDSLDDAVPVRLWVDLELQPSAATTGVENLGIDYDPEVGNAVESATYDKPLVIERERPYHLDVAIVNGSQPPWSGFSDGFESGDTSAWSGQFPP